MIDQVSALLALRARMLTTVVATTGSTTLSATATGYTRASGSFVADGFSVGMEIVPAGFAANPVEVVQFVSATTITTGSHAAQTAGAGRSLTAGIPALRAYENVTIIPMSGRPYIEESFVPATSSIQTFPANGGQVEETGLYVIRWFGISGAGTSGIRKAVGALKSRFAPGTAWTLADGSVLRIRGDVGPSAGQLIRIDGGWTALTLTIPWRARSRNAVAA